MATSHGVHTQLRTALQLEDLYSCDSDSIHVDAAPLSCAGVQRFSEHRFGNISVVAFITKISNSVHNVSAVKYLVNCSLPQLQALDIIKWDLDLRAAADLSEGNWPKLEWLNICVPSAALLQQIAKGKWLRLTDLNNSRSARESKYLQVQDFSLTKLTPCKQADDL